MMNYEPAFSFEPIARFGDMRNGFSRPRAGPASIALAMESFEYDPEVEYFLGGLVKSVGRAVEKTAKAVGRIPVVRDVGRAAAKVGRFVEKTAQTVGRIPVVGDIARAGLSAARLSLGPAAIAFDAAQRVARGEDLGKALRGSVSSHVDAVRDQLKLAEMVAPFIPGIGTGVAAALSAANALASGRPITEAVIAAARGALPGGAIAQAAFDTALNLARGKNIGEALLDAARNRLPGGPAARAAFDGALALAQGKKLQDAAFAAAGRILPPSPYAADALAFVKRVANGQNIQHAALSVLGQHAVRQIENRAGIARRELELDLASMPLARGLTLRQAVMRGGRVAVAGPPLQGRPLTLRQAVMQAAAQQRAALRAANFQRRG
jgi:hypothetical protein